MKLLFSTLVLCLFFACASEKKESKNASNEAVPVQVANKTESEPAVVKVKTKADEIFEKNESKVNIEKAEKAIENYKSEDNNSDKDVAVKATQMKIEKTIEKASEKINTIPSTKEEVTKEVEKVVAEVKKEIPQTKPIKKEAVIEKAKEVVKKPVDEMLVVSAAYDQWLRKYISPTGFVSYDKMKNDRTTLDDFCNLMNKTAPSGSKNDKMTYWINVYNANTIKLILDNYPLGSIMELEGGKVWKKKWIQNNGKTLSLDEIEHEILRKKYPDARIHFAVNCAAQSCPPILNRIWKASTLEKDLEQQTVKFINNTKFNNLTTNPIQISSLFDWYKVDFGDPIDYINKYSKTKVAAGTQVGYMNYEWKLNGK